MESPFSQIDRIVLKFYAADRKLLPSDVKVQPLRTEEPWMKLGNGVPLEGFGGRRVLRPIVEEISPLGLVPVHATINMRELKVSLVYAARFLFVYEQHAKDASLIPRYRRAIGPLLDDYSWQVESFLQSLEDTKTLRINGILPEPVAA